MGVDERRVHGLRYQQHGDQPLQTVHCVGPRNLKEHYRIATQQVTLSVSIDMIQMIFSLSPHNYFSIYKTRCNCDFCELVALTGQVLCCYIFFPDFTILKKRTMTRKEQIMEKLLMEENPFRINWWIILNSISYYFMFRIILDNLNTKYIKYTASWKI